MSDNGSPARNWSEYAPTAEAYRLDIGGADESIYIPEHAKQVWIQVIRGVAPAVVGSVVMNFGTSTNLGTWGHILHTNTVGLAEMAGWILKLARARGQWITFYSLPGGDTTIQVTYWI